MNEARLQQMVGEMAAVFRRNQLTGEEILDFLEYKSDPADLRFRGVYREVGEILLRENLRIEETGAVLRRCREVWNREKESRDVPRGTG